MKLIKAIYNAPHEEIPSYSHDLQVLVIFHGRKYVGSAFLHPDDSDFYSPKVGYTIALSRARIKIFEDEVAMLQNIFNAKYEFWREVLNHGGKAPGEVDPTGATFKNLMRTSHRLDALEKALKREKKNLKNYLRGQERAIESVKRYRKQDEKN